MTVFNSRINPTSDSFRKNRAEMLAHIEHLQRLNGRGAMISERRDRNSLTRLVKASRRSWALMPWIFSSRTRTCPL